ncbi:MAG TPA: hypothetical protein VGN23_04865 [Verrucomicrobiae bacterium]|jgi:hypothetical protein
MKTFWAIIFTCISFSSPADSTWLEGETFHPSTNTEVIWEATNDLPNGLWVYKVIPEAFSAAVVSNAMRIGNFTMKNYSKTSESIFQDKHLLYFFDWNNASNHVRRFLYIAPTLGAMQYSSGRDYNARVEAVPTADEAQKMAEDVLFQLGIDRELYYHPLTGYDETSIQFKYDRQTHQLIQPGTTNVTLRGVAFARRIDGVRESRGWCFMIHFRSHGEIEDFSLYWRNLLPLVSHPTLTPSQIVKAIKDGQAMLPPQFDDVAGIADAKAFTVTKITPRYFNGTGKEQMDFLKPYAELEMRADFATNSATFFLTCPILSTNAITANK